MRIYDARERERAYSDLSSGGESEKIKKKEGSEGAEVAMETDHQTVHNPVAVNSISPNQNLTPTSSLSPWPASRPLDMRNSHIDIDFNDFSDYGELLLCPDLSSNVTRYRCKKGIVNLA